MNNYSQGAVFIADFVSAETDSALVLQMLLAHLIELQGTNCKNVSVMYIMLSILTIIHYILLCSLWLISITNILILCCVHCISFYAHQDAVGVHQHALGVHHVEGSAP